MVSFRSSNPWHRAVGEPRPFGVRCLEHSLDALSVEKIDWQAVGLTHYYQVEGDRIDLAIHPNRLAVRLADGIDIPTSLGAVSLLRSVENGVGIFAGEGIGASRLSDWGTESPEILATYPVFVNPETGTELVVIDEVIVALPEGVSSEDVLSNNPLVSSYRPLLGTPDQFVVTISSGTGERVLDAAVQLENDVRIAWANPNFYQSWQRFYIPNDPRFGNLWHLRNTGQGGGVVGADAALVGAWDLRQGASPSIVIGVVDDGVDAHPDLTRWVNPGETASNSTDDDGNGWVDDIHGWNFVFGNNQSNNVSSLDMHGTSVAGVAGANGDNGIGVTGAAYGSKILSAKIFQGNSVASDANIASALYYAAGRTANGLSQWSAAQVVNNSWGGGSANAVINAALTWATTTANSGKGVLMVFASGNDYSSTVSYPANRSIVTSGVLAVGATNNKATRSDYSNYGVALDVVTPSNDLRPG